MTQARSHLIPPGASGTYHCVQRCVRRAFLCGLDHYTGQNFEHRKAWVEQRIALVAECFAAAIYAYAVMSNHLHLVVHVDPLATAAWSDEQVAERWLRLFPPRDSTEASRIVKQSTLMTNPARLAQCRERLGSLSWLMKCLAEPIARQANAEDACKGRFWEGRFKSQVLCDDRAVLAAMAYVDLNPLRAGMTIDLASSSYTSLQRRFKAAQQSPLILKQALAPVHGTLIACLPIPVNDYLDLITWTSQQVRPGKHNVHSAVPGVLKRWGVNKNRWTLQVKAMGSGYWRAVGEVADLMELAHRLKQRWLKGIGTTMALAKLR